MSVYKRGDVVSLSRSQVSLIDVLSLPAAPDEPYTLELEINPGDVRPFTILGTPGDTDLELLAEFQVKLQEQSVYVTEVVGSQLALAGPLGVSFPVILTPNLQLTLGVEAVSTIGEDGDQIGPIKVLDSEGSLYAGKMREFTTRTNKGVVEERNVIEVRELGTGRIFEVNASQILTVIEREGTVQDGPEPSV